MLSRKCKSEALEREELKLLREERAKRTRSLIEEALIQMNKSKRRIRLDYYAHQKA